VCCIAAGLFSLLFLDGESETGRSTNLSIESLVSIVIPAVSQRQEIFCTATLKSRQVNNILTIDV
jgi:hypothetical protein